MKCPYCNSTKIQKRGKRGGVARYECVNKKHPAGARRYFMAESPLTAKVLLFDIETLPMWVRAWRLGEENWNPENIIKDSIILSYAAKWLFAPGYMGSIVTKKEVIARDDKRITEEMHILLSQADIIIAHNGQAFDVGRVNGRFLKYDLGPPAPYRVIDTYLSAKKAFGDGLASKKLDYIAELLGVGRKHDTDYDLWKRCEAGEQDALDYMFKYNCQDIYLLEDVYMQLRPWITQHPNLALYMAGDTIRCSRCQSDDLERVGSYYTNANVYDSYQCNKCKSWTRHRSANKNRKVDGRVI